MKTASLADSSSSQAVPRGLKQQLLATPRMLARVIREQADSFPAIALAEGGDIEGAVELLARSTSKGS
jgi:hypothetical protein